MMESLGGQILQSLPEQLWDAYIEGQLWTSERYPHPKPAPR